MIRISYTPGDPSNCPQPEDVCAHCEGKNKCRQAASKPVDMKAIQKEAVKASQGSIAFEDKYAGD